MIDRILTINEVTQTVAKGRTQIYHELKLGTFPKPVKLSAKRIGFRASDIKRYIENLPTAEIRGQA